MKVKKILLILLFPFMAEFITACCDCPPIVDKKYTHKSVRFAHLVNQDSIPTEIQTDSIVKDAYGIRLAITCEETAALGPRQSLFFSGAYATFDCFCDPSPFHAKDSITGIEIYTLQDFDALHPAGSNISSYFREYQYGHYRSIADYLQLAAPYFDSGNLPIRFQVDLLLLQTPVNTGSYYTFKVRLALSDNRVIEQEMMPVKLY